MNNVRIKVKQWMTKKDNPMPMRVMHGKVLRETPKAIHVVLHGKPEPSTHCLHCNRKLTHKISVLYGIGPICGQHHYINPLSSEEELNEKIEEIKEKMANIKWEGWIPKSQIEELKTTEEEIQTEEPKFLVVFKYNGQRYRTTTNQEKLSRIRQNSEIIELEQIV